MSTGQLLSFSKYTGAGNDFLILDRKACSGFPLDQKNIASLCLRRKGIGADGLVIVSSSSICDYKMVIYNADGKEATMCGNAARCVMRYLQDKGVTKDRVYVETAAGSIELWHENEQIGCLMPQITDLFLDQTLIVEGKSIHCHRVNTGVEQLVLFTEQVENADLTTLAPQLRHHQSLLPKGANVNFVQCKKDHLHIRTYERGVEGETLACGTGAAASALIATLLQYLTSPIRVKTWGGDELSVRVHKKKCGQICLSMAGPAQLVYRGETSIKFLTS